MPAYMIAQYRNSEEYDAYRGAVVALNQLHGARILTKAGTARALEGHWEFDSMVVVEFESQAAAEAFYSSQAYEHIEYAWWLILFPGLAIFSTVASFNLVGERLREALDPRSE